MTIFAAFLFGVVCGWVGSHLHLPIRIHMFVPLTGERRSMFLTESRRQAGEQE